MEGSTKRKIVVSALLCQETDRLVHLGRSSADSALVNMSLDCHRMFSQKHAQFLVSVQSLRKPGVNSESGSVDTHYVFSSLGKQNNSATGCKYQRRAVSFRSVYSNWSKKYDIAFTTSRCQLACQLHTLDNSDQHSPLCDQKRNTKIGDICWKHNLLLFTSLQRNSVQKGITSHMFIYK